MSATYDSSLSTNKDWVRFLTGDTDVSSNPLLSDEEIGAVLSEEEATGDATKYYAAATCLRAIRSRLSHAGDGKLSKSVGDLSITWGLDGTAQQMIEERIRQLETRGAELYVPSHKLFRTLGRSTTRSR